MINVPQDIELPNPVKTLQELYHDRNFWTESLDHARHDGSEVRELHCVRKIEGIDLAVLAIRSVYRLQS